MYATIAIDSNPAATHPINLKSFRTGQWFTTGYEVPGKSVAIPARETVLVLDAAKIAKAQADAQWIMSKFGK